MVIRKFASNEELSVFAKKKGFIYQNSEIYGGLSGVYDYGHLGFALKKNFCDLWRDFFLSLDDNFVEIDPSVIMSERVFKASGHLENFFDPIVIIDGVEGTFRADHLIEDKLGVRAEELSNDEMLKLIKSNKLLGDIDYSKVSVENLNMMFPVDMGPKKGTRAYLRAETAQGPFVNFKVQFEIMRKKLPLGLAVIGKAFRNEISPRNLLLRTRELEQAELQIFFNPNMVNEHSSFNDIKDYKLKVLFANLRDKEPIFITAEELSKKYPKFYVYYLSKIQEFYLDVLKVPIESFRLYELNDKEKAFYNKVHFDVEVFFNSVSNWIEIGGCHYRTDHDLKAHQSESKIKHVIFDEASKEKVLPHVLELSFGVGRNVQMLLDLFSDYDDEKRINYLRLPVFLSPYKVAILPLQNDEQILKKSYEIYKYLKKEFKRDVFYDKTGGIGRRYVRQDEIGTAFCVTIDYESIEENNPNFDTVTIRDRDSKEQKRVHIKDLLKVFNALFKGKVKFLDL